MFALLVNELACRSWVWRTDVGVLPDDRELLRRDGYWVIRCSGNPTHWWGNYLLFDEPPGPGDGGRWSACFEAEFGHLPEVRHRLYAWDRTDGENGAVGEELEAHGFELERSVGLLARPEELVDHPRVNREVTVARLGGEEDGRWDEVLRLWCRQQPPERLTPDYRLFAVNRLAELRSTFAAGRGAWFVALDGARVVASLGVVCGGAWIRYQQVDTDAAHRGRGIATRLVLEAGRWATKTFPQSERLVIVADPDYHAVRIYESVGFRPVERVCAAILRPSSC